MNWWNLMRWSSGRAKHSEALAEVRAAKKVVDVQAVQGRKLTHSLRTERDQNHLGARIRLAMEGRHDER
jgi:hypothetical protein